MSQDLNKPKLNWFKKHKVITIIGIILILGGIGGASSNSSDSNTSNETNTNSTNSSNTSTVQQKTEYNVGEIATIDKQQVAVTQIQRDLTTQYSTPESGKEYILVTVQIINNDDNDVSYNTYDFELQDSNGVKQNEAFVIGVENKLNSGSLAPNGKVTGNLIYMVPEDDNGLKLVFSPSVWSSKSITFKL